jgi:hypothetical protein
MIHKNWGFLPMLGVVFYFYEEIPIPILVAHINRTKNPIRGFGLFQFWFWN